MIKVRVGCTPEISVNADIEAIPEVSVVAEPDEGVEVCVEVQPNETPEIEVDVASEPSEEVEVDVLPEFIPHGGDGSCLPAVTEQDDGKFLKVKDGKWAAQENEDCKPLTNLEIEKLLHNFT